MPDGWLSVQQAANACGVTYRTVYGMVQRGDLPAEKPDGRPYRTRRAERAERALRSSPPARPGGRPSPSCR